MSEKIPSPQFVEGFVKTCADRGMTIGEIETAWRTHNFNSFLATPGIYNGFREKLAAYSGPISKSEMAHYMTPEILALSAECHVKYANDTLSVRLRKELQLPEPSWDTVPAETRKTAAMLENAVNGFAGLPLQQKVLVASLAGAGVGGLSRLARPSATDQVNGRSGLNRAVRGAARGGFTGAGVAAGAEAGGAVGLNAVGPQAILPGMATGGIAGGVAANKLFKTAARGDQYAKMLASRKPDVYDGTVNSVSPLLRSIIQKDAPNYKRWIQTEAAIPRPSSATLTGARDVAANLLRKYRP